MRQLLVAIVAIVTLFTAFAAAADKPARVGLLVVAERGKPVDAFRDGLRELGYVEGRNLVIEYRSARGNTRQLLALARELVARGIDVLVTHSTPGTRAARKAAGGIPVVMASVGNAVDQGLVESVARPGGNVTGLSFFGSELAVKRVEVLKETLPTTARMALLAHPTYPAASRRSAEAAIRSLGMEPQIYFAKGPAEFDGAFAAMRRQRAGAVQILASPVFYGNRAMLIAAAARSKIPAIYPWRVATRAGGLISYGPDLAALFRRAAYFVDKILKGADPATLPVERPTKFELVVNLRTAKALDISIPRSILLRANEVIE